MARARAIETRLEKLLPSTEEYFTCGFLNREETQELARQRTHWEYRLVAKPLLLLDVQNAVSYELGLEKLLHEYCSTTKLILKHRWAILERIEYIYRIGIKHLKDKGEWELLRQEFIQFLKEHNRHSTLSALYGELMVRYPTRSALWVEAALYEGVESGNADNGRSIIQQAILTAGAQPEVWNAAFLIELHFADRLLHKLVEDEVSRKEENTPQQEKGDAAHDIVLELQRENAALASVVLELALVRAVMEEALESPACGPALVRLLLASASRFRYTRPVVESLMSAAAVKMIAAERSWSGPGLNNFLHDLITLEVQLIGTSDPAAFLRASGRLPAPSNAAQRTARVAALTAALTFAQFEYAAITGGQHWREVAVAATEELLTELTRVVSTHGISSLCRALLEGRHLTAAVTVKCLWGEEEEKKTTLSSTSTSASSLSRWEERERELQAAQAAEKRVQAVLELAPLDETRKRVRREETSSSTSTWSLWRFLLPDDRKVIAAATSCDSFRFVSAGDIERLLLLHHDNKDTDAIAHSVLNFFQEFQLISNDEGTDLKSLRKLRYNKTRTHITLWKVFLLLEEYCKPLQDSVKNDTDTDSDSDIEEKNIISTKKNNDKSYAAAGLEFLASVPYGSLEREAEAERLDGCWTLLITRVHKLSGLQTTTRMDFIECLQRSGENKNWVEDVQAILRVARLCEPLPRQIHSDIIIPFFEALALQRGSGSKEVQVARDAHEHLIAMYTLSRDLSDFQPIVRPMLQQQKGSIIKQKEKRVNASPAELNAFDWARLVEFERDVAKDLRRAKETAARARRLTLAPQKLLAMLNTY